jgi:predicted glutamine amidotransferase
MCVIIHQPKGKKISKKVLISAWDSNPDGAGISLRLKNNIQVIKGLMTFNDFYEAYEELKNFELVIHFRFATHGAKIPEFTHPFKIDDKHHTEPIFIANKVLHHNGI